MDIVFHAGLPSPSASSQKPTDSGDLQQNQSLGQRIMGNVMENRFLRSFTSKTKSQELDVSGQSQAQVVTYLKFHTFTAKRQ